MERLIADAAKLDSSIQANDLSFGNIVRAINVVQTEMGITGTTALEAGRTISGSVGAMKSAWTNLVTGLADGNADIGQLVDNLVTTIVGDGTENNLGVLGNVMPAVRTALGGASKLIGELLPVIVEQVPTIINDNLPILVEAAVGIVQALVDGISQNQEMLFTTAFVESFVGMLPQIVQLGLDLLLSLANGIAENLPTLIPTVIDVIFQIVDTLTDPKNLENFLDASLEIIMAIADGIVEFLPKLIEAAVTLIERLIVFLLEPENLQKLGQAAVDIVVAIAEGLIKSVGTLMEATGELIQNVADKINETDWKKLGKDIVDGIWTGLKNTWSSLENWFTDAWDNLVAGVKNLLGIHSPSRVFAGIGKNMALGVGEGWEDEFALIKKDIDNSLVFDDPSIAIGSSVKTTGGIFGGNIGGVSVVQNIYSQAKTAADLMQEALYQQERAVRLGV